jgi:hypothetical protein
MVHKLIETNKKEETVMFKNYPQRFQLFLDSNKKDLTVSWSDLLKKLSEKEWVCGVSTHEMYIEYKKKGARLSLYKCPAIIREGITFTREHSHFILNEDGVKITFSQKNWKCPSYYLFFKESIYKSKIDGAYKKADLRSLLKELFFPKEELQLPEKVISLYELSLAQECKSLGKGWTWKVLEEAPKFFFLLEQEEIIKTLKGNIQCLLEETLEERKKIEEKISELNDTNIKCLSEEEKEKEEAVSNRHTYGKKSYDSNMAILRRQALSRLEKYNAKILQLGHDIDQNEVGIKILHKLLE